MNTHTHRYVHTHTGVVISGPTNSIAPVDKALYALRDVTGTASSLPLIVSSIMSKKLAEGPDGLLLDVKTGDGAFLPDWDSGHKLAQAMLAAGVLAKKRMVVLMTDMSQPLGQAVGNWLELREALDLLSSKGPSDVRELVLVQCALMLEMGGKASSYLIGRQMAQENIRNGKALQKLKQLVRAQGLSFSLSLALSHVLAVFLSFFLSVFVTLPLLSLTFSISSFLSRALFLSHDLFLCLSLSLRSRSFASFHLSVFLVSKCDSRKLQVSFVDYGLFLRSLLQKRPIILRSLPIVANPYANKTQGLDLSGYRVAKTHRMPYL